MNFKGSIPRVAAVLALVLIATSSINGQPKKPEINVSEKTEEEVLKILSMKGLWTEEFPSALYSLNGWKNIDQTKITVFHDKVVGNRKYQDDKLATSAASKLDSSLKELKPEFTDKSLKFGLHNKDLKDLKVLSGPEVIHFFGDDDSTRIALKVADTKHQMFRKDLQIEEVRSLLGAPQRIQKQELRKADGEGRPTILTLHEYADGLITFAESDLAAKPGTVNRIIVNVPSVSKVLFKER